MDVTTSLQTQLTTYRRNVRHITQQAAKLGGEAHLTTALMNELHDARIMIATLKAQLRNRGFIVTDEPDDVAPVQTDVQHPIAKVKSHFSKHATLAADVSDTSPKKLFTALPPVGASHKNFRWQATNITKLLIGTGLLVLVIATIWQRTHPDSRHGADLNALREQILREDDKAARDALVRRLWIEGDSGLHQNNQYDPSGCPGQGYGVAWNISHNNKAYRSWIIVFSTPQQLVDLGNGWYVQLCLNDGTSLSASDVGSLQAAILTKDVPGVWNYTVIE